MLTEVKGLFYYHLKRLGEEDVALVVGVKTKSPNLTAILVGIDLRLQGARIVIVMIQGGGTVKYVAGIGNRKEQVVNPCGIWPQLCRIIQGNAIGGAEHHRKAKATVDAAIDFAASHRIVVQIQTQDPDKVAIGFRNVPGECVDATDETLGLCPTTTAVEAGPNAATIGPCICANRALNDVIWIVFINHAEVVEVIVLRPTTQEGKTGASIQ